MNRIKVSALGLSMVMASLFPPFISSLRAETSSDQGGVQSVKGGAGEVQAGPLFISFATSGYYDQGPQFRLGWKPGAAGVHVVLTGGNLSTTTTYFLKPEGDWSANRLFIPNDADVNQSDVSLAINGSSTSPGSSILASRADVVQVYYVFIPENDYSGRVTFLRVKDGNGGFSTIIKVEDWSRAEIPTFPNFSSPSHVFPSFP